MAFWEVIQAQLHYIPQTILVAVLLLMSFLFISDNKGHIKERIVSFLRHKWIVVFLSYTAFLFTVTIFARFVSKPVFSGVGEFRVIINGKINKEVLFNFMLFIPYTFSCLKSYTPKHFIRTSFFLSFGTTLFIEVFQFLFWVGHFTIADIVYNTLGGMFGCCLWRLFGKSGYARKNQSKQ